MTDQIEVRGTFLAADGAIYAQPLSMGQSMGVMLAEMELAAARAGVVGGFRLLGIVGYAGGMRKEIGDAGH